jgi:hypothetical protein
MSSEADGQVDGEGQENKEDDDNDILAKEVESWSYNYTFDPLDAYKLGYSSKRYANNSSF